MLPFLNHSGDAELDAFGNGVGDEVVHRLAQLPACGCARPMTTPRPGQDRGGADGGRDRAARRQPGPRERPSARRSRPASISGRSWWTATSTMRSRAGTGRRDGHRKGGTRHRRGAWGVPGRARGRQSRRAEPLPPGPIPLESAHRGRSDEGLDFFEKALAEDSSRRSRTAASPTPTGCSRTTASADRREVWTKAAAHAASAVMIDDGRRKPTRRWRT